ncbi:MAG: HAD family hydrolase [Proteobacteria bacterium]|nr:HAD family hydrolase [Pseudomonadota bacterium]
MRVLALDFDGVISDSAPEAFVVALRTYVALRPDASRVFGAAWLDAVPTPDAIEDELYRRFVELMPLGNRAEDFGVCLHALETGASVPDQAAYDAVYRTLPRAFLDRFHQRFYATRAAFREAEPEAWRALLGPYPAFARWLRERAAEITLAVATAKDRASVEALLLDYGLADLFAPERIFDKETGRSKRAHLERLRAELGVAAPEITFVDDKVNHLEAVAPLGVRCALAGWGYNGEREHRLARAQGFRVLELDALDAGLLAPPAVP